MNCPSCHGRPKDAARINELGSALEADRCPKHGAWRVLEVPVACQACHATWMALMPHPAACCVSDLLEADDLADA
jgi:hypothetical protein